MRVISPFCFIFLTQIVNSLTWPVSRKSAYMTPLHKLASKADLYNFIYEKIRHKLSDCQHGFRSRRNTFTLLLDYVDKLPNFNDKNEDFRCVYFDF